MPEFRTAPEALTDAARAVAADSRVADQVAGALRSSVRAVGQALPGSGTADETERLAGTLAAEAAALVVDLAAIGGALAVAGRDYADTETTVTGEFNRTGRWPA